MKLRQLPEWLPSLLSLAASIVFAAVLVVETVNFRANAAALGDDAKVMWKALDVCECAAGLLGVCAVASIAFAANRMRARLRRMAAENAQMRQMEKFRRDFVANVTHEIRTPLTGIMAAVELLSRSSGALSEAERNELFAVVAAQSAKLDTLARDILSLARIESRRDAGERAFVPANLGEMVAGVRDAFASAARLAGVEIEIVRCDPVRVSCDVSLVEQAFSNLVENALRHSGSGKIELSLAANGDRAVLTVIDHGGGVPDRHKSRIFERFYRADKSRSQGGSGLGLAIVKHVAALHGGEATVADTPGGGATFAIAIPCAP